MFYKELETSVYWMTHKHNIKAESNLFSVLMTTISQETTSYSSKKLFWRGVGVGGGEVSWLLMSGIFISILIPMTI